MKKKVFKYSLFAVVIIVISLSVFALRIDMRNTDQELSDYFEEHHIEINIDRTNDVRSAHTLSNNEDTSMVVFVHGAPGSGDQFKSYMVDSSLRSVAPSMIVDRPGYGYSQYGQPMIDITNQAEAIRDIILTQTNPNVRIVLVSHSYGGPICAVLSRLLPDRIKSHLMLNPVIDPFHEKEFWYSGVPLWWPIKYFSSGAMKVAAHEKLSHAKELIKLEGLWKDLSVRTIHIQGDEDWLAPTENAEYVRKHFNPKVTEVRILPNTSHFIPFSRKSDIIQWIIDEINL